jgi:hypothetical protein
LSCLTNSSSVFPLISILFSSAEILSSTCSSLLDWPPLCFVFLFHSFFLRFSISWVTSFLILSIFVFNSFIILFIMFSFHFGVYLCLLSFCFCVFSYSLFLLCWNFLSASCMFWLTMSSNMSMKFWVITCRLSSLEVFLWPSLGFLASFIFVLLESGTGYPFSSFPSESCIKLFFGRELFQSFFCLPIAPLGVFLIG